MTVVTFNQEKQQEVQHKIGNWYKHELTGDLYILAWMGHLEVNLVCVKSGQVWSDSNVVQDEHDVSQEEMDGLTGGGFTLVSKINIQEI